MGAMGGLLLAICVYYAKYSDGNKLALIASGEQFMFNFLLGGALMKMCEKLSTRYVNKIESLMVGILIPSTINISCTYLMHSMDSGEVDPIYSTIPSAIFAPMGYIWWGNRKRNQIVAIMNK